MKPSLLRACAWISAATLILAASSSVLAAATAAKSGSNTNPTEELGASYEHIVNDYYKKVDAHVLTDGARQGLIDTLKAAKIANPVVDRISAAGDDTSLVRHMLDALHDADARYGGKVNAQHLLYGEIDGLAKSVHDRYTVFLSPQERAMLNESLDGGNFSGVGLSIDIDPQTHYLRVDEVIPGGPAMRAGIQDGDYIIQIDGKSTRGLTSVADSKKLRGKVGTRVQLTVRRDNKDIHQPFQVTRAIIHDPSVVSKMLPGKIGYIRLSVFGSTTGRELNSILDRLDHQGAVAFVLDLRDNGGGYLTAAIDVSSNFVPSGGIVSVEDRGGMNTQYDAKDSAIRPRPLVVLVNRSTASASEITSGAIQDHGVGTLIGTRTFGKGVVQTIFPLPDGAAIKVTTQHYYTPRGRDINKVGIQPDINVIEKLHSHYGDTANDAQLNAGLGVIHQRLESIARDNS